MDRPSERVRALALSRPATLGPSRLICVDGPSGSGKSTLAAELGWPVVPMDLLYDGWGGLASVDDQLASLLLPLASRSAGRYRRYDWEAGAYAETVVVPPTPVLVLEGVGSYSPAFASLVTVLVWVEAPESERLARAIARDGAAYEPQLRQWALDEQEHFRRTGARERADLVVRP